MMERKRGAPYRLPDDVGVGSVGIARQSDVSLYTFLEWWENLPTSKRELGEYPSSPMTALFISDHKDVLKHMSKFGMRVYHTSGMVIDTYGREIRVKPSTIGQDAWRGIKLSGLLCPFSFYVKNPNIIACVRPHHTIDNCVFY